MGDETLEFEAGKVMAREIAGPLGLRREREQSRRRPGA
jgi:hypothetical protein